MEGGGDRARSAGTFLTATTFKLTTGADVYAAVSMDQVAARELAKETQLTSLERGIESNAMVGTCDGGFELRLHEHRRVADAGHAVARRAGSPRRLRAPVR